MKSPDDIYPLLGRIAVGFAALEYNVNLLLERMMCGDAQEHAVLLVRPLLIDGLALSQMTDKCRLAAKYLFEYEPDRLNEAKEIFDRVDAARVLRNFFIHGQWLLDDKIFPTASVTVLSYKKDGIRCDKESDLWEYGQRKRVTINELVAMETKVDELIAKVQEFTQTAPSRKKVATAQPSTGATP